LRPTGTGTDLGRLFEAAIEHIPSSYLSPKGGVRIKQIARMERNKLGTVIAAPGRKPEFTSAACLFSYQRLHEISSGQIGEKSLKKFLLIRFRIRSQSRAQYGTVSYVRRTRSAERTPEYFRRKRRRAFADLA
jgi:hypothetical protein